MTEEYWVYIEELVSGDKHFTGYKQTTGSFNMAVNDSGRIKIQKYGTGTILSGTSLAVTAGVWHHLAWTRDGSNVVRVFLDGVVDATTTTDSTTVTGSADFHVGSGGGVGNAMKAHAIEYRRTEGVCRYTGNFTKPSARFPRDSDGDSDFASVVLLFPWDTTTTENLGSFGGSWTEVNNPTITNEQGYFT
jgi:hypothetical protein